MRCGPRAQEAQLANKIEQRIYRLFTACALLVAASFIVPRFVSNPEGGFAAGASAVLVFLAMLAASLFLALYLAALTTGNRDSISKSARIAGIGPAVVLALTLLGLGVYLRF